MESEKTKLYIGNGMGKTTSAIGQGIRALGNGKRVYMVQFLATQCLGEMTVLKRLEPDFNVFCFEKQKGPYNSLSDTQKEELKNDLQNTFNFVKKVLETRQCDLLILDEILTAMAYGLITQEHISQLIKHKPDSIELILTGQSSVESISNSADYVIEVRTLKRP